ncbi:MAG: pyridoxamine 5'-phosphate oxidase family protein [Peptococcaceae bacterium]|nr:pyridoxamine 5'-phosphate oxidase family protein [Peptococcaceae bacterium]
MFREMRRSKQQMSEEATNAILKSATSGVLSLLGDDGYPYGVPISYVYEDGKLYFHSALSGHKVDAVRNYDKASFTVIVQDDIVPEKYTTLYRSVVAFGNVHIAEDEAERVHGVKLLAEKYNPGESEAGWRKEMTDCPNFIVLVMEICHVTGKASRELVE